MRVFASENKVLYVENPATWADVFRLLIKRNWKKLDFLLRPGPKRIEEEKAGIYVMNPGPVIPVNFLVHGKLYTRLLKWNNRMVRRKVKRALKKLNMQDDLIHINAFNPMLAEHTLGFFDESINIYYCYDEISAAHYMKEHGAIMEPALLANADLTVVSSEGLLLNKKDKARRIALIKNGVDFSLFSQSFRENIPEDKIIGYVGSIDDRLDRELLHSCFEAFPEWTFEFVGRVSDQKTGDFLSRYENVRLRGAHPSCDLPVFLRTYRAGIIPFLKNEFTRGIYPLKINEYLAGGLPVVLTDFGILDEFSSVASIAAGKEAFVRSLRAELEGDTTEKRKQRKEWARHNSWQARAETFSTEIEKTENELKTQS